MPSPDGVPRRGQGLVAHAFSVKNWTPALDSVPRPAVRRTVAQATPYRQSYSARIWGGPMPTSPGGLRALSVVQRRSVAVASPRSELARLRGGRRYASRTPPSRSASAISRSEARPRLFARILVLAALVGSAQILEGSDRNSEPMTYCVGRRRSSAINTDPLKCPFRAPVPEKAKDPALVRTLRA
jgi:hypothetical protein